MEIIPLPIDQKSIITKITREAPLGVLDLCCGMGGLTLAANNIGLR